MGDDGNRSKPTRPPSDRLRGEDSPPGQYRPRPRIQSEPIARVALRAAPTNRERPSEEYLQALSQTEGRLLIEMSDMREQERARQAELEAELRRELKEFVQRSIQPPAPTKPTEKKFELSQLQYVAAFVVALTGLIALILNSQKPSAEVLKRFDAVTAAQEKTDQKIDQHIEAESKQRSLDREQDYKYALDVRSWVTDVLERAASVKIDDPPGTPKRDQLGFYPPPRLDPHKITDTHIVQPRDPYPVPPPP
jgi:hypothetical protein